MGYKKLDEVTGVGKRIILRDKYSGDSFCAGVIEDEVSRSDGEQKYFIQRVFLDEKIACDGDATRYVYRVGYYTQRTDGFFCLGSQYAPTLTPDELRHLLDSLNEKG